MSSKERLQGMNNDNADKVTTPLSTRSEATVRRASKDGAGSEAQYIALYEQCRQLICDHSADAMNSVRDEAFRRFAQKGFPTRKVERYKYTDMAQLFAPDYGVNLQRHHVSVDPYEAFKCDVPNLSTSMYFIVNDAFYDEALPTAHLPEGVIVGSMREHADLLAHYYNRLAGSDGAAETDLNTMLAQDGLMVYVPKGIKADRTIQVVNILKSPFAANAGKRELMVNRRVLIVVEESAEIKLLFCDHTADDLSFLTTQVTEAFVGENAKLDLYCMEETHNKNVRVSNVYIDQAANSRVRHNVLTLHNGITRNKLDLTLSGEGAECGCYGLVIADKQQHTDNNTLITHKAEHCTSNELYKYVLDEKATGAFAGRVLVEHGAQKTTSQMTNQNLCITPDARMFTQPMLEIYADDVKCAHGSTVGQLNDAAMFYMRQRGISEREARTLLMQAFAAEVVGLIRLDPLRDRLNYLVDKRFRGEFNKCKGCKLCK